MKKLLIILFLMLSVSGARSSENDYVDQYGNRRQVVLADLSANMQFGEPARPADFKGMDPGPRVLLKIDTSSRRSLEPATMFLLGMGLMGIALIGRRIKR